MMLWLNVMATLAVVALVQLVAKIVRDKTSQLMLASVNKHPIYTTLLLSAYLSCSASITFVNLTLMFMWWIPPHKPINVAMAGCCLVSCLASVGILVSIDPERLQRRQTRKGDPS